MAQYYISAQVKVDTSTIQTQLNAIKDQTLNVKVKTTGVSEAAKGVGGIGDATKTAAKSVKSLGSDFVSTLGKVAKFAAVTSIIGGFTAAVTEAVTAVKDLDDAQTELMKVSDLSGASLEAYSKKLAKLGEITGNSVTTMTQAATEFKKSGYSDDESAQLANVAEMFVNISDEELTAGDSASFIISQLKAFNLTADQSEHIIDGINEVDILAFLIEI